MLQGSESFIFTVADTLKKGKLLFRDKSGGKPKDEHVKTYRKDKEDF